MQFDKNSKSLKAQSPSKVLVYPLDSLISEFGGALGLFLGFSFLDFILSFSNMVRKLLSFMAKNLE